MDFSWCLVIFGVYCYLYCLYKNRNVKDPFEEFWEEHKD